METCSSFLYSFFCPLVPLSLLWITSSLTLRGGWRLAPPHDRGDVRSAPLLPPLGGEWSLAPPLDRGVVRSAPASAPALGRGGDGRLHPRETLTTLDPLLFSPPFLCLFFSCLRLGLYPFQNASILSERLSFIPGGLSSLSSLSSSSSSLSSS